MGDVGIDNSRIQCHTRRLLWRSAAGRWFLLPEKSRAAQCIVVGTLRQALVADSEEWYLPFSLRRCWLGDRGPSRCGMQFRLCPSPMMARTSSQTDRCSSNFCVSSYVVGINLWLSLQALMRTLFYYYYYYITEEATFGPSKRTWSCYGTCGSFWSPVLHGKVLFISENVTQVEELQATVVCQWCYVWRFSASLFMWSCWVQLLFNEAWRTRWTFI